MDRTPSQDSCCGNQLTAYLSTLATAKKGLPHGQPVCVCASPSITTTDGLLQLAASLGPHIAILQVYADIIDDWSVETGRQLTLVAKRHGFLVWEGGRILNSTVDVVGKQRTDVREVRNELVSLIRKKYTKGVIRTASWAGIATAWASGVAVDNQEADILIPALKAAARETVAGTVQTIRTVITAENGTSDPEAAHDTENAKDHGASQQHLSLEHPADDSSLGPPQRKSSTISLTQTISQHTEESTEFAVEDAKSERRDSLDQIITCDNLPPPPLLARGIVLCLPSVTSTSFTLEYRQSCIAAARANPDFVVGFLCSEPWQTMSQRDDVLDLQVNGVDEGAQDESGTDSPDERQHCLAIFSLIPHRLKRLEVTGQDASDGEEESNDVPTSPTSTPTGTATASPVVAKLYTIVEHALELREKAAADNGNANTRSQAKAKRGPSIMHIPVVSLP
ncbi:hypothetical protein PHISP_04502 [Aspergillus sp. HF37]|nr:hypothetical protein PHISP_04502 [Aspergillus sp. HF37]